MAKPIFHAINSAKKFGGKPEDYQKIHCKMDSSKAHYPKMAHRLVFHSDFGHKLVQEFVGTEITNSEEEIVSVQNIADQHTFEDLGFIPTLEDYSKEFGPEHPLFSCKFSGDIAHAIEMHSEQDAHRWGGSSAEYSHIHEKMYSPGQTIAGRAIFHSSFGIYLIEELYGVFFKNSNGRIVAVRDIAEQHVLQVMRSIPTLAAWLDPINKPWMAGLRKANLVLVD